MLIEDLVAETLASNQRAAERVDAEVRELDELQRRTAALEQLRQQAVASARQASEYALARMPQVDAMWASVLQVLRNNPSTEVACRLLGALLNAFQSGQQLVVSSQSLWRFAESLGAASEKTDDLQRAHARFQELSQDAKAALEARTLDWQPADPARLELGLSLSREGKALSVDDARARFRRT